MGIKGASAVSFHVAYKALQCSRLLGEGTHCLACVIHSLRCFGRNGCDLLDRSVDFFAGCRLLLACSGNCLDLIVNMLYIFKYLTQCIARTG